MNTLTPFEIVVFKLIIGAVYAGLAIAGIRFFLGRILPVVLRRDR